jgi:hypothetical protein
MGRDDTQIMQSRQMVRYIDDDKYTDVRQVIYR